MGPIARALAERSGRAVNGTESTCETSVYVAPTWDTRHTADAAEASWGRRTAGYAHADYDMSGWK